MRKKRAIETSIIIAIAVIAVAIFTTVYNSPKQKNERLKGHLRNVIAGYFLAHSQFRDSWWLDDSGSISQDFKKYTAILEEKKNEAERILNEERGVSALSSNIFHFYKTGFNITVFRDGGSMTVSKNGSFDPKKGEICFIPSKECARFRIRESFYFRHDWQAVMVKAINYPEILYRAYLMHELGHGFRLNQDPAQSKLLFPAMEHIHEELEMHELGYKILNKHTGSKYQSTTDEIITKKISDSWHDLISKITTTDLIEMDRAIGAERVGGEVCETVLADHLLYLGWRFLSLEGRSNEIADIYSFIRKNF